MENTQTHTTKMAKFTNITLQLFNANTGNVVFTNTWQFDTPRECRERGMALKNQCMDLSTFHSVEIVHNECRVYLNDGFLYKIWPH